MNETLLTVISFSIGIAALIGLVRFRKIDSSFLPFLIMIWLGLINETISFVIIRHGHSNAINANLYSLLESLLILWFFRRQGLFAKQQGVYYVALVIFLGTWIAENFIFVDIFHFDSYFNAVYAFVTVLMSVHMLNRLYLGKYKSRANNANLVICLAFILFYTYSVLVEIFWIYGLNAGSEFRNKVYTILDYIDLTINLMYALAILWMPNKQESILL